MKKYNEVMADIDYVQFVDILNIKWDADNKEDVKHLPISVQVKVPLSIFDGENNKSDIEYIASEYMSEQISNRYGFCHLGFNDTFVANGFFENAFQDYMDKDGKFIPKETLIGYEIGEDLKLLEGISFAVEPRTAYLELEPEYDNEITTVLYELGLPNGKNDIKDISEKIITFGFNEMEEYEIVDSIRTQLSNM